jgi:hypothetical protein
VGGKELAAGGDLKRLLWQQRKLSRVLLGRRMRFLVEV